MPNGKETRHGVSLDSFLNPQSMLTPGIAGSLVLFISMTVASQFHINFPWTALTVSFLIALAILGKSSTPTFSLQGGIYCILNTLIIFSMCAGAQDAIMPGPQAPPIAPAILKAFNINTSEERGSWRMLWAPESAHAQAASPQQENGQQAGGFSPADNATQGQNAPAQLTPQQIEQLRNYLNYRQEKQAYDAQYKKF